MSFFLLGSGQAWATIVVPLSIEDLTERSEIVLEAEVTAQHGEWTKSNKRIITVTELKPVDTVVGLAPSNQVRVHTLGGVVDNIGMKVAGTPQFAIGEHVFVFLRKDPAVHQESSQEVAYQVIGMAQGKFSVDHSQQEPRAIPSLEGLAFLRGDKILEAGGTQWMKLDALKKRVRSHAQALGKSTTPISTPSVLPQEGTSSDPQLPTIQPSESSVKRQTKP